MKRFYQLATLVVFSLILGACTNNPQQTGPSPRTQCISLQRQQLFVRSKADNASDAQLQKQRIQYEKAYQEMGCNQIMQQDNKPNKK